MPHRNPPSDLHDGPFGEKFETQIVYKLGTIEADVKSLSSNLLAAVLRLEARIEESGRATTKEIEELEEKLDKERAAQEKKIESLERDVKRLREWKDNIMVKLGFLVSALSLFWFLLSDTIKEWIN